MREAAGIRYQLVNTIANLWHDRGIPQVIPSGFPPSVQLWFDVVRIGVCVGRYHYGWWCRALCSRAVPSGH